MVLLTVKDNNNDVLLIHYKNVVYLHQWFQCFCRKILCCPINLVLESLSLWNPFDAGQRQTIQTIWTVWYWLHKRWSVLRYDYQFDCGLILCFYVAACWPITMFEVSSFAKSCARYHRVLHSFNQTLHTSAVGISAVSESRLPWLLQWPWGG